MNRLVSQPNSACMGREGSGERIVQLLYLGNVYILYINSEVAI